MRSLLRGALLFALSVSPLALMAQTVPLAPAVFAGVTPLGLIPDPLAQPQDQGTGLNSYAAGGAIATGNGATGIGFGANASGAGAWAGGLNALASGDNSVGIGPNAQATGTNGVALGLYSNASGEAALAIGQVANAAGVQSTAVGANASALLLGDTSIGAGAASSGGDSTAIGAVASATAPDSNAFGNNAKATANSCTALGTGSLCDVGGTVSVGYDGSQGGAAEYNRIMNAAPGIAPNDVMVVMQGQGLASALGGGSAFSVGTFVAPNYSLGTQNFNNVGSALSYLYSLDGGTPSPPTPPVSGGGGSTTDPNAVHYDDSTKGSITLGGANGTLITNVAPGAVTSTSTDAVNGGQLYASQQAGQAYTDQKVLAGVGQAENWAKTYTDQQIAGLNKRLDRIGSMSMASAQMAASFAGQDPSNHNRIAVGVGAQGGDGSLSVGYQHVVDGGHLAWNVAGSISGPERSIGAGMSFGW